MSKTENLKKNSILFLDNFNKLSDLNSFGELNSLKIITFDYQTHKKLEKLSIPHLISDTFLDSKEKEKIQNNSYIYSKWFDEVKIKEHIEYNGVNLGSLSYIEFFIFLIPFLKKFVEVKNIVTLNPNSTFLASGMLLNILKFFSDNFQLINSFESENFAYDKINFETNFLKIKLSRNTFLKIKNISEKIISIFLLNNLKSNKNSIFLVEFNTILYEKLLFEIFKQDLNPIYLGNRRPAIWNLTSYSVIKNSHTQIASFFNISSNTKKIIDLELQGIQKKWDMLLSNDDLWNNFFTYDGISFWNLLKPSFIKLHYSRNQEYIKIIELSKIYFEKFQPKFVLILSESGTTEQIMISLAKKFQIPIILLQHGVAAFDSKHSDIINEFTGSMPIKSNKFFVWGNAMKKYCIQFGIPENKIEVLGSIAHENLFQTSLVQNSSDYILLNPEYPGQTNVKDYDVNVNQEYEDALRNVCKITKKLNKKLIIKIKPHIPERDATKIAHEVDPSIKILKTGNMAELIKHCSIFVTFGITSAMLDAAYFQKPVIRIRMREWWDSPDTLRPQSAISIYLNEFEDTVKKLFYNNQYFNESINNGKKFLDDCLSNNDSVHKLGTFLTKFD